MRTAQIQNRSTPRGVYPTKVEMESKQPIGGLILRIAKPCRSVIGGISENPRGKMKM